MVTDLRFRRLRLWFAPAGSRREQWFVALKKTASGVRKGSDSAPEYAYMAWIRKREPPPSELERQTSQRFAYEALFSIITPVYNPAPAFLHEAIRSVQSQTYARWELCLVNGDPANTEVVKILREYADRDPRVRPVTLERNRGISGNSNVGLEMAQGEYVVFLDHDDVLAPFALFELVTVLNQNRDWDMIYSDHDVLSANGQSRSRPLFKPGWSPEIMLSANYVTHLTAVRTCLARAVGGFNPATDGAQDWDLFLRVSEKSSSIAHIPQVLYHWRDSAGSTATDIYAKAYAPPAQLRVIQDHLARQGRVDPCAFFDPSGFIRVSWSASQEKVSIIIPTKGANPLLERCLDSILSLTIYPDYEIVLVNNGERKPSEYEYLRRLAGNEKVRIFHFDRPFNYSAVNNFGAAQAEGQILLFLNNDTRALTPDWLTELAMWAQHPEVGAVGAKLLSPNGTIQHAGVIIGLSGFAGHVFAGSPAGHFGCFGLAEWYRNYAAVTGACMAVRKSVFDQVGGFSEEFMLCGSDVEFCLRLRAAGYRVVYNPFARLEHVESATHRGSIPDEDFQVSYRFYLPMLESGDPYFNPNLSYWSLRPSLRTEGEPTPLDFTRDFLRSQKGNDGANAIR